MKFISLVLIVSACSKIKDATHDSPPNSSVLKVANQQSCQSNTQNFNRLLEEDISADINCLKQSLNDFYAKVQTHNKNVIEKDELSTFVSKYSPNQNGQKGIDLLYLFNHLFRGDEENSLSKNNFNALSDILLSFNQEMIKFYPYIEEIHPPRRKNRERFLPKIIAEKISLDMHLMRREIMIGAVTRLQDTFKKSLNDSRNMNDRISFDELLTKLERSDSLVSKVMAMTSFPENSSRDLIKMVLDERTEKDSATKIISFFALTQENAQKIVTEINDHTDDGNEKLIREIRSLLFFKRALLGGDTKYFTYPEMRMLADKLPAIMTLIYDFINLEHIDFISQKGKVNLLTEDLKILLNNIAFDRQSDFVIVSLKELLNAADEIELKVSDILLSKLSDTLKHIKQMVSGGELESISAKDLYVIVDKVNYGLKMVNYTYDIYNHFRLEMDSPFPLSDAQLKAIGDYPSVSSQEKSFKDRFNRAVGSFRFFKGNFEIPYYVNEVRRNVEGVAQSMIMDYALGELLSYLTNFHGDAEQYYLLKAGKAEVLTILDKFKDFFRENNLASKHPERTADNARLVTDLFQTQSNGDGAINLNEGIEFVSLLSTSSKIGNEMVDEMISYIESSPEYKDCKASQKDGIQVSCYRKVFFRSLRKYEKYFTRLYKYVNSMMASNSTEKLTELLQKTEFFARDCALDSRPIFTRDMLLIMGGLLNIESTLLHFDKNYDNQLDTEELNAAFPIYRSAIISAAQLKPSTEKYAHSIFFYLIKFQKLPSQLDLLKYHFFGEKKAVGDRVTIATLLKYINSMSAVDDPDCKP